MHMHRIQITHKVDALMIPNGGGVKSGGIYPCLAMNPLEISLVAADEGVWDQFGSQQIKMNATRILASVQSAFLVRH